MKPLTIYPLYFYIVRFVTFIYNATYKNNNCFCYVAEELYYKQLFDNTQQSACKLWKYIGQIINPIPKNCRSSINKKIT